MNQSPIEKSGEISTNSSAPDAIPNDGTSRFAVGCLSIVFGLFAGWMLWIVHNFLDRRGWFDWIVGQILDEIILAVAVFAIVLLIWAVFAPPWIPRLLAAAYRNLTKAIMLVVVLLFGSAALFVVVGSALSALGIIK